MGAPTGAAGAPPGLRVFPMSDDPLPDPSVTRLPVEILDRLTRTYARFLTFEAGAGVALLVATMVAVSLANSPWAGSVHDFWSARISVGVGSFEFARSLRDWINNILMTLFFFLVALELKRELVLGELRRPRVAALSAAAAVGGMVVPAAIYLALQWGRPGMAGWGAVVATDTAFVIGALALLGRRIPQSLRVFMLSLAIFDDIGAILVVALGYSHHLIWQALVAAVFGIAVVVLMARLGVRGFPLFYLVGGLIWLAMDISGIHATITGVILGLMTPARRWVDDDRLYAILDQVISHPAGDHGSGHTKDRGTLLMAETAAREALSPVERLEIDLHPWVAFVIMPVFALANAGLAFSSASLFSPLVLAVCAGLVVGKPVGIVAASWLATRVGIAVRPPDLSWGLLAGGALLAGIGFTMSLLIAGIALPAVLLGSAKLGIFVASVISGLLGLAVLWCVSRRRAAGDVGQSSGSSLE